MKNAGKACNNRLYRHIRTFEKIVKNYFVISDKYMETYTDAKPGMPFFLKMKGNTVIQILEKPMV